MQIVRLFLLLAAIPLYAGPQGGTVIDGTAAISVAGKVTTIDQLTDRAIINWQKFESTPTETIQFNQPGNLSLTLNRVVGVDPSFIGGALQANGGLFIVNPNGIVFGPNAQVNVNSLVASTGGGAIVVQTGSSSSSAPTVGARDNVLLTSSRSSLVKQDSAGGPATGGDDVVVVKNDAPDGEGDAEEDQPERKRRSATRAND